MKKNPATLPICAVSFNPVTGEYHAWNPSDKKPTLCWGAPVLSPEEESRLYQLCCAQHFPSNSLSVNPL